jgi:hypothetical protein
MVMAPSMITARLAAVNLVRNPADNNGIIAHLLVSSSPVVGKIVLVRTKVKWS